MKFLNTYGCLAFQNVHHQPQLLHRRHGEERRKEKERREEGDRRCEAFEEKYKLRVWGIT